MFLKYLFKIRHNISQRYLKKIFSSNKILEEKLNTQTLLVSYLNEFCFSYALPMITFISELLILTFAIFFIFIFYELNFYFLFLLLFFLSPLLFIVKKSRIYGEEKINIEKNIFVEISCYLNSVLEVRKLNRINFILNLFDKSISSWLKSIRKHHFINQIPRIYIENLIFLSVVILLINFDTSIVNILDKSSLLIIILPLLRLLPSIGRLSAALQQLKYASPHINEIVKFLGNITHEKKKDYSTLHHLNNNILEASGYIKNNFLNLNVDKFFIPQNKITQIKGLSGSGKSTFLKILSGVTLDGCNIEISAKKDIFKFTSFLPDRPIIISASCKDNILLGKNNISKNLLKNVIRISGIDKNTDLFSKELLFNGENISTGQKQRIGLARILINKPKLLIIDEGLSNLPKADRSEILTSLIQMGITVLIVDHGISITKNNNTWDIKKNCLIAQ